MYLWLKMYFFLNSIYFVFNIKNGNIYFFLIIIVYNDIDVKDFNS